MITTGSVPKSLFKHDGTVFCSNALGRTDEEYTCPLHALFILAQDTVARASVDGAQAKSMHDLLFLAICPEKPGDEHTIYSVEKQEVNKLKK